MYLFHECPDLPLSFSGSVSGPDPFPKPLTERKIYSSDPPKRIAFEKIDLTLNRASNTDWLYLPFEGRVWFSKPPTLFPKDSLLCRFLITKKQIRCITSSDPEVFFFPKFPKFTSAPAVSLTFLPLERLSQERVPHELTESIDSFIHWTRYLLLTFTMSRLTSPATTRLFLHRYRRAGRNWTQTTLSLIYRL